MREILYSAIEFGAGVEEDPETGEVIIRTLMFRTGPDEVSLFRFTPEEAERLTHMLSLTPEEMRQEREAAEARAQIAVAKPGVIPQGARLPR